MLKTTPKRHRRAYVNPLPGYPEAAQRADIIAKFGEPDEWYVESRTVTRAGFIQALRAGDEAVVARMGCLAKPIGRIDARMADLLEARGDVHGQGCTIFDAEGFQSNRAWLAVKEVARDFLRRLSQGAKSKGNGSVRKYNFTDKQILRIVEVRDLKSYTNDTQRLARLKKDGIVCGRTYMVTTAPQIARDRGLLD